MKLNLLVLTTLLFSFTGFARQGEKLTDAEITNTLMTANTEEMNMARVARKNSENTKVQNFANMMYTEHAKNNDKVMALAKKEKLMPKVTASTEKMKASNERKVEELEGMTGRSFDRAYMAEQIKVHENVLQKLDQTLIPNAKNSELKAMLNDTRDSVQKHLQEAREIQTSL
jgi:putative membrane protein